MSINVNYTQLISLSIQGSHAGR